MSAWFNVVHYSLGAIFCLILLIVAVMVLFVLPWIAIETWCGGDWGEKVMSILLGLVSLSFWIMVVGSVGFLLSGGSLV